MKVGSLQTDDVGTVIGVVSVWAGNMSRKVGFVTAERKRHSKINIQMEDS